ncbi:MAG TPA: MFS transporter [Elusimicrobiales bacterium]|nr:MFS transporter [Elusimicrobiales bacterium]HOL62595.1 MFS transporter [Elusimicrobiales bacterium]HPO95762.1 MFS transporter [Elusimicrobiales bacterium]
MKNNPVFLYPDFRNLFIARVISAIGDKFFTLSLAWWVIDSGNKFGLSLVMAATFLPVVLFSPFMGALSDRHNKKYLMLIADFFRALILFILVLLLIKNMLSLWFLLLLVFFIYSFAPLFETATASSILPLTSEKHLAQATAVDSSSIGISNVVGAMLGSVFIAWLGFKGSVIINIFTYLISFVFVFMITKNLKTVSENNSDYLKDLKTGFLYIKNDKREILRLLLFFAVLNFFVSPILILIPVIIKFILVKDVKWLAVSESFFAFGVLSASFLMSFKKDIEGNIRLLIYTIFSFSLFFAFTALSKNPYLTSFFLLLCGFSISVGNVAIVSYFQYNIENEYKGRFFSLVNTVVYAIMPVSFVANGFMIDKINPSYVIILNSAVSFIIGIFGLIKFK